jgi:hypothetical protein
VSHVFVVDTNEQPLNPVHPARARILLDKGLAAVFKRYPFTIILKTARGTIVQSDYRIKIDPGSQTTGIAIVSDQSGEIVFAAEIAHRGEKIKASLDDRRALRRSRRHRKTRYRKPRFRNRRNKKKEWLPPSLQRRISNVLTWVNRLRRLCPLTAISLELVKFDTHLLDNPDIAGVDYQQGELQGYEVREYLLALGLPIECGSGGLTKYNRSGRELPKTHWCDAACVGNSTPVQLKSEQVYPLLVTALGHGKRQMCLMERYGFPRTSAKEATFVKGFQTGDIVKATVASGKKAGSYVGRVAVRASGSFDITTKQGKVAGIGYRSCRVLYKRDGYRYRQGVPTPIAPK